MQTKAEGSNLRAFAVFHTLHRCVQLDDSIRARRNLDAIFQMCALRVPHLDVGMIAVPFDLAFPHWSRRMFRNGLSDVVEAALLTAEPELSTRIFMA
jgi:hypothetical protein